MRAVKLTARIATIELAETFVIARERAGHRRRRLRRDRARRRERATARRRRSSATTSRPSRRSPTSRRTRTSSATTRGRSTRSRPGCRREEPAARAAIDAALHDLQGKLAGLPVWRLLGLRRAGPPTSWTIWLGDPDDMARRTEAVAGRFKRLKLKLGGGDGLDVERVRAVRGVTDLPLMVDVNEAWSVDEALEALPQLAELGVEYCEQPIPAHDPGGPTLKGRSPIPIFVDEDCHVAADVPACAERAHGVNIKLAKSGGIREAVRIAHVARALGLGVMLGCMNESGPRDRRRRADREPLRPRRPRRQPPAAPRPVAGRRARRRRPTSLRQPRARCQRSGT